jgi:hypothetical protein
MQFIETRNIYYTNLPYLTGGPRLIIYPELVLSISVLGRTILFAKADEFVLFAGPSIWVEVFRPGMVSAGVG